MSSYTLEGPKWATRTITWSFADPGSSTGGQFSGLIDSQYQSTIRDAVARWDDLVDLTFVQVPDTTAGVDIRIGWGLFGASEIGETGYTYSGSSFLAGTTVRLEDPSGIALSASPPYTYVGYYSTLYQVALHELGHALGLGHSTDADAIMYPVAQASNRDLDQSDLDGIHALYAPPAFALTDVSAGGSSHPDGAIYSGPVTYLQQQFIYSGSHNVAIAATMPNVFVHGGPGDDAIAVSSGQNVLDGGQGSNFLVGGTGTDTFYLDARGGQVTWGTLVNFHPGDTATIWGYNPSISSYSWGGSVGVAGYTGPTLQADVLGNGVKTMVTFAALSAAEQSRLAFSTGTIGGNDYLMIVDPA